MLRSTLTKRVLAATLATLVAIAALAQSADVALAVRTDAALGDHLVDGAGMTLYLFTPDEQGASTCVDACAENWPPLLADGDVAVAEGLDAALVGTVERADGALQVTYGGWPLYTFVNDAAAGDANGQGINDVWYVVGTDGTALGAAAADGDAAGGEDALFEALMDEGAGVYHTICAACHGVNGNEALASHVVLLADNDRLENQRLVLRRVIHGSGYMPGFGAALSDREVAAVATYVRNSFGNEYGIVGEEAAAADR
jgi:predicted lipoprotein with Yx(FWY)xxD motif